MHTLKDAHVQSMEAKIIIIPACCTYHYLP